MPRARNIKPSFFKNDLLSDQDPLGRLLFIGLWTICDYRGCLEWRPKRVKAEILPYDDCDIEALAINLDKSGFIRFYSDGCKIFAKVVNFTTHQNPHKNERQSGTDIPDYTEEMRQAVDLQGLAITLDKSGINREQNPSDPADSCFLIPDSPILNPDAAPKDLARPMPKNKFSDEDLKCAEWLFEKLRQFIPDCQKRNMKTWAKHVRDMRHIDGRSHEEICRLWLWCRNDSFEAANVQSPEKLRNRYDQLKAKMKKVEMAAEPGTRDRTLIDDLTDRSWAK